MVLSEQIARLIEEMLEENEGDLLLARNELAGRLGCVPSQINYVLTSRFTPSRGYLVESRRGGGGYIRITRMQFDRRKMLLHYYDSVGEACREREALLFLRSLLQNGAISEEEERLSRAVLSEDALSLITPADRAQMRAHLLKTILLRLAAQ